MAIDRLNAALANGVPGCNWIVRFADSGHAEAASAADLDRIDNPAEGFFWLHLDAIDRCAGDILGGVKSLTPAAREVRSGDSNHPFVEFADRLVFGALVDHRHSMDGPQEDTDCLRFACGPGFVITGRRMPLCSADATRRALADGARTATPVALFDLLVANLCKCSGALMREVAASLGQRADALARDAANLQDRARMLQDEINAILTTETNDRLYTLTVITAMLLPATLVTGYFGMNTKVLPFAEHEYGMVLATVICVAASFGALLILRKMGLAGLDDPSASERSGRSLKRGP